MKSVHWLGDSRKAVSVFPRRTREVAGHQLFVVQCGGDPADWKPMHTVGAGVRELRVHLEGEWRMIYLATLPEAVYVLHAFGKKTRRTARSDIAVGGAIQATEAGASRQKMTMATKTIKAASAKPGKLLIERGSGNVFADIEFAAAEATNLRLRSKLMLRVGQYVRRAHTTQTEAALALGITQPRLNALLKGRIDLFSLDALVNMLARVGMSVELKLRKIG